MEATGGAAGQSSVARRSMPGHAAHTPSWAPIALAVLVVLGAILRVLLAYGSPTPYGYVYDFYHEAIQQFYALGRLPVATDCWQCYQPPLLPLLGLPLYSLGKALLGGPGGLQDPALRVVAVLPLAAGAVAAYYTYRILRFYRLRGRELVVGTGLTLAFPCLFISSYGIEADIVLTALMTAFLYYMLELFHQGRHARYSAAILVGLLAGLACETKYSGLIAPAVLVTAALPRIWFAADRARLGSRVAVGLAVCVLVGSWTYVEHRIRYGNMLFANGSAQQGFAATTDRPWHWELYDFGSLRLSGLADLVGGDVPPGQLTELPIYRSVWTTLHAMAWGDMTFFSDPTRHGEYPPNELYPRKRITPWIAVSVLVLGLLPTALAAIGFAIALGRRVLWPLVIACGITWAVYVTWFVAQETWALKTKYILFLLPAYALYAMLGWRWIARRSALAGDAVYGALVALLVVAHAYLFQFAVM